MMMDIAAMSMSMSAAKVQQSVNIAMLKDTMNQQEMAVQNLVKTISTAGLGAHIDTYA